MAWGDAGRERAANMAERPGAQVDRMKNDTSRVLFHYWNAIRGTRRAPRRFEIEPARISRILPEAFILEQRDVDTYRFRIAGTRLCELFGMELRGHNFLELWEDGGRFPVKRRLARVAEEGAVGLFEFEAAVSVRESVSFEVLIVPLIQKDAAIDRFLGTMSPISEPLWRGVERLERCHLLRHELIWPEPASGRIVRAPLPEVRDARLVRVAHRSFRVYEGGLSRESGKR